MPDERHLIVTIGKNPLPVLVALRRMCKYFGNPPVTAVVSRGSQTEYERIKTLASGVRWDTDVEVDPYEPSDVFNKIVGLTRGIHLPVIHLHYTGGTKAMGVAAMEAIKTVSHSGQRVETSYLDSSEHALHSRPSFNFPADERKEDVQTLTVTELAQLHGFTRIGKAERVPEVFGEGFWILLQESGNVEAFKTWLKNDWHPAFRTPGDGEQYFGWPSAPPKAQWPEVIAWFGLEPEDNWNKLTEQLATVWPGVRHRMGRWQVEMGSFTRNNLSNFYRFLTGTSMEQYVFHVLDGKVNAEHSFEAKQESGSSCQIDVTVMLGYQLVAISCTTDQSEGLVKHKAFEVYHRARQIGGDAARALVLSLLDENAALSVEDSLRKDIGIDVIDGEKRERSRVLQVWGKSTLKGPNGKDLNSCLRTYFTSFQGWNYD